MVGVFIAATRREVCHWGRSGTWPTHPAVSASWCGGSKSASQMKGVVLAARSPPRLRHDADHVGYRRLRSSGSASTRIEWGDIARFATWRSRSRATAWQPKAEDRALALAGASAPNDSRLREDGPRRCAGGARARCRRPVARRCWVTAKVPGSRSSPPREIMVAALVLPGPSTNRARARTMQRAALVPSDDSRLAVGNAALVLLEGERTRRSAPRG